MVLAHTTINSALSTVTVRYFLLHNSRRSNDRIGSYCNTSRVIITLAAMKAPQMSIAPTRCSSRRRCSSCSRPYDGKPNLMSYILTYMHPLRVSETHGRADDGRQRCLGAGMHASANRCWLTGCLVLSVAAAAAVTTLNAIRVGRLVGRRCRHVIPRGNHEGG